MTAARNFWLRLTGRFGSRRIIALASIFAVSTAFSLALAISYGSFNDCSYGGYGCAVPCTGGVGPDGYVRCDGYVRGDAYVRCDGYVRADGYMGCNVNQDGYSIPGVGCDAYIACTWAGCDAYTWPTAEPGLVGDQPDLTVTSANAPPVFNKGSSADVSWTVTNAAGAPAEGSSFTNRWTDMLYLSSDAILDPGDLTLANEWIQYPLAPGSSYDITKTLNINNIANGTYFLIIKTDDFNQVGESNEMNNTRVAGQVTIMGDDPDLTVTSLSAASAVYKGNNLGISFTVNNQGPGQAIPLPAFGPMGTYNLDDGVYLSADSAIDGSDVFLGSKMHSSPIAPGASYDVTISPVIPNVPSGDYYLIAKTDAGDRMLETNESNNTYMQKLTVMGADPDLAPGPISAPDNAQAGQFINFGANVLNQGAGSAVSSWMDGFYFSTDDKLDAGDIQLGWYNTWFGLAPSAGYFSQPNFTARIPDVAPGDYYLIFKADYSNSVFESNEDNNIAVKPITVTPTPQPDLSPAGIDSPDTASTGEDISASWTVYNQGDAGSGTSTVGLYISAHDYLDGSAALINYIGMSDVPAGSGVTQAQSLRIPDLIQGSYYLLVESDAFGAVPESNESNNVAARPITIKNPDLIVNDLEVPYIVRSGDSVSAAWHVYNAGAGTAIGQGWLGSMTDSIYLSNDNVFDASDTLVGSATRHGNVNSGETYASSTGLVIPAKPSGNYYLIVVADYSSSWGAFNIFESNESNNTLASQIVIDDNAPVLSNVHAQSTPCGGSFTWSTDEPASEQVFYGDAAGGPYSAAETQYSGFRNDHDVQMTGLTAGATYYYRVVSSDMAGNTTASDEGSFVASGSEKPALGLKWSGVYWQSYADYLARVLTVDYRLENRGTGRAYNVTVTGSSATQGVTAVTEMPFVRESEMAAGSFTPLILKYYIPDGVNRFSVYTSVSAVDSCGGTFTYP
ncbi:MAG: CARDB domain-containing protein [Thermoleophilia bacterium]